MAQGIKSAWRTRFIASGRRNNLLSDRVEASGESGEGKGFRRRSEFHGPKPYRKTWEAGCLTALQLWHAHLSTIWIPLDRVKRHVMSDGQDKHLSRSLTLPELTLNTDSLASRELTSNLRKRKMRVSRSVDLSGERDGFNDPSAR
jgi:hypothetical protein